MNFVPDDAQQMIRDAVRDFAVGSLRDAAARWDAAAELPAAALAELGGLGMFGMAAPEALGGAGLDALAVTAALEELGAAEAGIGQLAVQHALCLDHLLLAGTPPQHARYARRLATGKLLGCHAHGEDADNLDSAEVRTQATRQPDGTWRIDGEKPAVVAGGRAGLAIVTARTDEGGTGLTAFVIALDAPGVECEPVTDMLGLRTAGAALLRLRNVHVSDDDRLGAMGGAAAHLEPALDRARLGTAAVALGVARSALREAGRYSQERQQFGKPISAFQPIQWMIANSGVDLETARLLVWRAAWLVAHGKPAGPAIAMAKARACEAATRISDRAVQVLGGYGYTTDFPVERAYRDAAVLRILHGSTPLQHIRIARSLVR